MEWNHWESDNPEFSNLVANFVGNSNEKVENGALLRTSPET
jgi:hypothetical protein